jgi:hypothetical protein
MRQNSTTLTISRRASLPALALALVVMDFLSGCGGEIIGLGGGPGSSSFDGGGAMGSTSDDSGQQPFEGPLVGKLDNPRFIALDESSVYWTDSTLGVVAKVSKAGGEPVTLASSQSRPLGIAVDDTNVYWANDGPTVGAVMSIPKTGGTPATLAARHVLRTVAIDDTNVYWMDKGCLKPDGTVCGGPGVVMTVPKSGGMPITVATIGDALPGGIAVDTTTVYWTEYSSAELIHSLLSVPKTGGQVVALGPTGEAASAVALDDSNAYIVAGGGVMIRVPKDGSHEAVLSPLGICASIVSTSIAVSNGSVFWTCQEFGPNYRGQVLSVATTGGTVTTIATAPSANGTASGLAVDDKTIYWSVFPDGALIATPRE